MSDGASSATTNTSKSTSIFTSALVLNAAIAGIEIAIFVILFKRFRKIYEPRTYLVSEDKRPQEARLPKGLWRWFPALLRADSKQIIRKNGLDAYQYLRFLWMMVMIFVPFWIVSWTILFPVDAANSGGTNTGIDIFTFGNIGNSSTQQKRYAAHLIILYFFTFWVFWLCDTELKKFVIARHDYISSPEHAALQQSKTVLVTGVPRELLTVEAIENFFRFLPGGIERIWLSRDLGKDMPDRFDRRNKAALKLEAGNTKLAKQAIKLRNKAVKAQVKGKKDANGPSEVDTESSKLVGDQLVPRKKRPTHKLGLFGLFGKKVDTIDWAKEEFATTDKELQEYRGKLDDYKANGAVFVRFHSQIAAHMFQQCLAHDLPLRMSGKYVEVAPEDVIWSNLSINPYQAKARRLIGLSITTAIIIFWTPITAFVTSISNIQNLCAEASWLRWLCNLPDVINGIIQGIVPPAVLALLYMLVPIVFRKIAVFEGIPLRTQVERSLMVRFFVFLVLQGFLVSTVSSGLAAAIPMISKDPSSAVTTLAQQLPNASTFFLTYLVTTQLSGSAGALLQVSTLILFYVFLFLLASTPRKVYKIRFTMGSTQWGTTFPNTNLLMVIAIAYSVIAPMINGFAAVGFFMTWFVYKYLFLYVYEMPPSCETGGLFFPTAIQHIFVALYIEEACMAGLFFLARDSTGGVSALPEAILAVVLIVITIGVHALVNAGSYPLINNLPLSLAGKIEARQNASGTAALDGAQQRSTTTVSPTDNKYDIAAAADERRDVSLEEMRRAPTYATNASASEKLGDEKASPMSPTSKAMSRTGTMGSRLAGRRGSHAFDQPVAYEPARVVWLPDDPLGISRSEMVDLRGRGIEVSILGAFMNDQGKVNVERSPPDEDWIEPPPEAST